MERLNRLTALKEYQEAYTKIRNHEQERIFCRHDMGHFLDVARIAYILALESQALTAIVSKEIIYTAALLHDIGRFCQYETGEPHEVASHRLARPLLMQAGFEENESTLILEAILNHRNPLMKEAKTLSGFIYQADKLSRACYACESQNECDWPATKKNSEIKY